MSESGAAPQESKDRFPRVRSWGGYAWFMSFGTFLPLPIFVAGYLAQLTFVGAPLARRRDGPFGTVTRIGWFAFVGWWLGGVWTLLAWSVLLLPYPFPDLIRKLLADLPSVMTLGRPDAQLS